jgi:hypothetical protein
LYKIEVVYIALETEVEVGMKHCYVTASGSDRLPNYGR